MTRFLIEQNGVYYLTSGKLLRYDPDEAQTDQHKQGVAKVKAEFQRLHDLPHTWYKAVEVKDASFAAINTAQL
jgi:hypothetical protein